MATNVTYITVLQVIEAFAAQHLQIKRFHSDFPDNIPDFSNDKEDFPILFVSPTNSIFQINTNIFQIRVYCFDLITEGRENINSILSDTHSILSDLQTYLRDGNIPAIDLLQTSNLTPLNNALLDYAAGWYVDIQLEVSTSDMCAIPFSTPPIISDSICNSITFSSAVPATRKLTINNVTYDLSEDRTWVIFSGTSTDFQKGDGSLDSRDLEDSANKQNSLIVDGFGIKYPTVDAVNFVTNELAKATLNTGFLETIDGFTLYAFDEFTLGIQGSTLGIIFKPLLDSPPFGVENAIVQLTSRTVPLSEINIADDGNYIQFVGYRQSDDKVIFSDLTFHQTNTTCQLGIVLVKVVGGVVSFIDPDRTFVNKPDIAAYSNLEETAIGMKSSVVIAPAETNDLHIQNNDGSLIGISVNWQGQNNDLLPIFASDPAFFTYLAPLVPNTFPIVTTEFIDPTQYFNGSILTTLSTNTKATVQRFLITVKGTIVVQYGEFEYNNFNDAKAAVFIAPFTDILPERSAIEIGRLVTRKTTTNLNDDTQAYFVTTGNGSGGGSNSATVAWGNITGDITNQTDLVEYIDEQIQTVTVSGNDNFVVKYSGTGTTESNITDDGTTVNILTNAIIDGININKGGNNDFNNIAIGQSNQINTIVGQANTSVGYNALRLLNFGSSNTVLGTGALENVINVNQNTAIGTQALGLLNSAGSDDNVAIGVYAGTLAGAQPVLQSNLCIYIGNFTSPQFQSGNNNVIVIGGLTQARGGNNTVTIGNTSITDNFFNGNIRGGAFIKDGGTANQFLKADGSIDNNTYLTTFTETDTLQTVRNRSNTISNFVGSTTGMLIQNTVLGGTGISIDGNNSGTNLFINSSQNATGIKMDNSNTTSNPHISINNHSASSANAIEFSVSNVNKATLNRFGDWTAQKFVKVGGLSTDVLLANGDIAPYFSGSTGGSATITGTTNFVAKFNSAGTGLTESIIRDNGLNLGINTSADTVASGFTINFGNQFDRSISIDDSANGVNGKTLIVKAGRATSSGVTTQDLQSLGQTTRAWVGASINTTNGDRYACVYTGADADVYKQTGGVGNFVALGLPNRNYRGVAVNSTNGDVYVCVLGGDIYKQTGGIGAFNALGQTVRNWTDITINSVTNDVYAIEATGGIYKQTASAGNFILVTTVASNMEGVAVNTSTNDVFVCTSSASGQIYKQTGGVGSFISLTQTTRNYQNLGINSTNGDVIVCVFGGDLYKLVGGVGTLTPLGQTVRNYNGLAVNNLNGSVLACVNIGDLYFSTGINASAVDTNGGKLQLKAGMGKGAGQSRIELITGLATTSSSVVQSERASVIIDENANLTVVGNIIKSGGTSNQFLKANGSVDSTSYQPLLSNPITGTGTPNRIPKFNGTTVQTNSRLVDDGFFLGIGNVNALTFDLQFGYTANNRTIAIEDSDNLTNGKELILKAGRTTNTAIVSTNMTSLGQGTRNWYQCAVNQSNGDIYVVVVGGDIYKQTGGIGAFVALGQTTRQWFGIAINSTTNDVYAAVNNGDIYKQTGGVGNFIALGQTSRSYQFMGINSVTNDVYVAVFGGDLYKQTGGVGNFVALGQTSRQWVAIEPNQVTGDVYATVDSGDIYKQTGGIGNFVALGQTSRQWRDLAINHITGDVFVCVPTNGSADIFKQTNGVGNFIGLGQANNKPYTGLAINLSDGKFISSCYQDDLFKSFPTFISFNQGTRKWIQITANPTNNDVYVTESSGDIYKQTGGSGAFIAQGQTARLWNGIGINTTTNDVWASVDSGDIYKRTGGVGNFVGTGQVSRAYQNLSVNSVNGDVYVTVYGGDLYKLVGGVGTLVALGAGTRNWLGIYVNPTNNDVWATVDGGDIYKQTGGVGAFVGQAQASRAWRSIIVNTATNEVYATVSGGGGEVYRLNVGSNAFISITQGFRDWNGITLNQSTGNFYATVFNGDLYISQNNTAGLANLSGGTLTLKAGQGKGAGQSRIQFVTGDKILSGGTSIQTEKVRVIIDESGNTTFNGAIIKSGGTNQQILLADGSLGVYTPTLGDLFVSDSGSILDVDASLYSYVYWTSTDTNPKTLKISNLTNGRQLKFYYRDVTNVSNTIDIFASTDTIVYSPVGLAFNNVGNGSLVSTVQYGNNGAVFVEAKNLNNTFIGFTN